MWSRSIEIFNPYEAIKEVIKKQKIKHEKAYATGGYLYIKSYNPYVRGVVGTDIKLTFKQKIQILFCKGVSVCIGDAIKTGRREGE